MGMSLIGHSKVLIQTEKHLQLHLTWMLALWWCAWGVRFVRRPAMICERLQCGYRFMNRMKPASDTNMPEGTVMDLRMPRHLPPRSVDSRGNSEGRTPQSLPPDRLALLSSSVCILFPKHFSLLPVISSSAGTPSNNLAQTWCKIQYHKMYVFPRELRKC